MSTEDNIYGFKGAYEFLSLGYNQEISYNGITYTNAESAYWAQRVKDTKSRFKYSRLSGNKARAKAMQATPQDDWEETKLNILEDILRKKFSNDLMKKKLKDTGDKGLLNINTYRDAYYGIYDGRGKNILGRLLMKIRSEI